MNVIIEPSGALLDRETLSHLLTNSERTIRRHCHVARYHNDGRALYEMEAAITALKDVETRQRTPGP